MNITPQELLGRDITLRGSALARALLRLAGWRLLFNGLPAAQGVAIVYPHTSNWDFVVGMLAKWGVGIPITFWGKHSLFRIPIFGAWLRWLGGQPVVRNVPQGKVVQMVASMGEAVAVGRFMWLALAPEGTRSRSEGWRSGFYRVAVQAGVPVALVVMDYQRRVVGFDSFWRLSGDVQADFELFARRLAGCQGRLPHLAGLVRPGPSFQVENT